MNSIIALLVIIMISFLVVRVGTNALVLTGLSYSVSRFQAVSAFFGVGFTTSEAEMVMSHVVRRRVIRHLIISGNIGLTSALATVVVTFTRSGQNDGMSDLVILGIAILSALALALFLNLKIVTKPLDIIMKRALERSGVVRAQDYDMLLKLQEGYNVSDFIIVPGHPWAGLSLAESRPSEENVAILNILHANGEFTGAPNKENIIMVGDEVMIYGSNEAVDHVVKMKIKNTQADDPEDGDDGSSTKK